MLPAKMRSPVRLVVAPTKSLPNGRARLLRPLGSSVELPPSDGPVTFARIKKESSPTLEILMSFYWGSPNESMLPFTVVA